MEQFLYTDGQTDTTKHYSPQTIRNGWGLKISSWVYSVHTDAVACLVCGVHVLAITQVQHVSQVHLMYLSLYTSGFNIVSYFIETVRRKIRRIFRICRRFHACVNQHDCREKLL